MLASNQGWYERGQEGGDTPAIEDRHIAVEHHKDCVAHARLDVHRRKGG